MEGKGLVVAGPYKDNTADTLSQPHHTTSHNQIQQKSHLKSQAISLNINVLSRLKSLRNPFLAPSKVIYRNLATSDDDRSRNRPHSRSRKPETHFRTREVSRQTPQKMEQDTKTQMNGRERKTQRSARTPVLKKYDSLKHAYVRLLYCTTLLCLLGGGFHLHDRNALVLGVAQGEVHVLCFEH
jgi:hypothetical protein